MSNWLEIIIAAIVIIASIAAERNKKTSAGGSSGDDIDLSELSEFFKKSSESGSQASPQAQSDGSYVASEASQPWQASGAASRQPSARQPKPRTSKKKKAAPPPIPQDHFSSEGACLDDQESLTGKFTYDSGGPGLVSEQKFSAPVKLPMRKKNRFDQNSVLNGFIMSTLLEPYNINRFFDRIPKSRNQTKSNVPGER